ncbi:MAG: TIGR04255 family protein [Polyangiaceae bacterium]
MARRIYPRPPIVEAIIEFRLLGEIEASVIVDAIRSELGHEYSESEDTESALVADASFLVSRSRLRSIGCARSYMSVHALAPYPGWEEFREQALAAAHALAKGIEGVKAGALVVRYVDRIRLPMEPEAGFSEYFTIFPMRPAALPEALAGFRFDTETRSKEGVIARLTVTSEPDDDHDGMTVGYDLLLLRHGAEWSLSDDSWLPVVEELHVRQREIFEQSITDRMRELFS